MTQISTPVRTAVARRPRRSLLGRIAFAVILVIALAPAAFVFFWMLTSSFKQQVDIYTIPPKWFDFTPTLDNYRAAFSRTPFGQYMMNSLIVAACSSVLGLVIGLPAAYSIARYRQHRLSLSLLTARLLPGVAYLVPFFVAFTALRMVGTYPALILAHVIITFPLTVFIMVNFFAGLPEEIFNAAEVDGCGKLQTFWRIALPLTRPGMLTSGILAFIFSWNDFKMALILSDADSRTLPVAVFSFVHEASLDWGPMMAYASIIMLPVLILTLFAQRHIVTGMTMGSVK
ncbi:carbohydrate ABC transporter permease [Dactylosporangium sp. NPDC000555]|uniref:carbohydrate ABC transporter permease n=1 Tax=Dactylosporangium sp. NPDC000555 TaxID=3154260 RepID=UPI003329236A